MNVDHSLLFHLDIPLSYYNKLQLYYYIPENRIKDLKVGGFVYLVDKLVLSKSIVYAGILYKITEDGFHFGSGIVALTEVENKYHLFYRIKKTKIQTALALVDEI